MTSTALSPTSKATRILNVLRANPGKEMTPQRVCDMLAIPLNDTQGRYYTGVALSCAFHRSHAEDSPWMYVHKPRRGVYVFDPDRKRERKASHTRQGKASSGWSVVAEDGDAFVLRSPEGGIYTARRLSA